MKRVILSALATGAIAFAMGAPVTVQGAGRQVPALQIFTTQQAAAGKAAFTRTCAACHMPDLSGNNEVPALAGAAFLSTWRTRTTKDLFDYMSGAMPPGGPSQSVETYTSIVAYVLQANGAVAGQQPLSASTTVPIASVTPDRSSSQEAPP